LASTPITREYLKGAFDIEIGSSALNAAGTGFTLRWKASS
jgi:hypothetical protein